MLAAVNYNSASEVHHLTIHTIVFEHADAPKGLNNSAVSLKDMFFSTRFQCIG